MANIRKGTPENNRLFSISGNGIFHEGHSDFVETTVKIASVTNTEPSDVIEMLKESINAYANNMPYPLSYDREDHYNPSNL
ncbi:hypothetical protein Turpa_1044 [Turneriella parva DSM 21527]|uniref:Uncharacterized protein n=1 Tax=Turneriella parva (strain ATCC BAA-1111 / DSM 21527 / NCTC 11395 / H) TaxID=869212 RepID=I4B336_TURPD|nr:hypothetical protein Turpa_1044 [Turneriella parva DSM 21527]